MSYTGYLITSAKLDLNWWLPLSQCPQGGNIEIKSSGSGKVGFQCHELRRPLSTHTRRRGWRAGAAAEGRTDPAQPKSAESPPTEGCVGKATPASSHISSPSMRGSSASAAHPDSAAGSQGWVWSSMFVPTCLKQFLVFMADAEPKICPAPSQLALL